MNPKATSRSGLPPAVIILVSDSGLIPRRRSAKRNPKSEVDPTRFTPPVLPLRCCSSVIDDTLTMWSTNVGTKV